MNIAVLGADRTGRELTQRCVRAGYEVNLYADEATTVMDAIDTVERRLETADSDAETLLERFEGTTGFAAAVSDATLVIETTVTDGAKLQREFATIEEHVDRETLVATSNATVRITAAAAGLRHPDRALGLQFHRLGSSPLVEIVSAEQTTADTLERAEEFVAGLDAPAVVVEDVPGQATARLALALETEAIRMVQQGVAGVAAVDRTLTAGYEHPVGPLEQADRAGLADRLDLLETLTEELGERFRPPELLVDRVESGATGRDAGEGFYVWEQGEPTAPAVKPAET